MRNSILFTHYTLLGIAILVLTASFLGVYPLMESFQKQDPLINGKLAVNLIKGNTNRFDHIVKSYPSFQIAKRATLEGKPVTKRNSNKLFPNVLQESFSSILTAIPILIFQDYDAAQYCLFIFILITYYVSFKLLRLWGVSAAPSALIPVIMILGYNFILYNLEANFLNPSQYIKNLYHAIPEKRFEYNSFYRQGALGTNYFVFLTFMYFLSRSIKELAVNRLPSKKSTFCLITFGAVSFYTYLFYSIATGITLVLVFAFYLARSFSSNTTAKRYASYFLCAGSAILIAGSPSLVSTFNLLTSHETMDWVARIKGETSIKPYSENLVISLALILGLLSPTPSYFKIPFAGLALATIFFENMQFILGFNIQPGHLYMRTAAPYLLLGIFAIFYSLTQFVEQRAKSDKAPKLAKAIFLTIVFISFIFFSTQGARYAYHFAKNMYSHHQLDQSEIALLKWLDQNAAGKTIGTLSPELANTINIYSNTFLFNYFSGHRPANFKTDDIYKELGLLFLLHGSNKEEIQNFFEIKGSTIERRYLYYFTQRVHPPYGDVPVKMAVQKIFEHMLNIKQKSEKVCTSDLDFFIVTKKHSEKLAELPLKENYSLYARVKNIDGIEIFKLKEDFCSPR